MSSPLMEDLTYPYDLDGIQACQCCGETLKESRWVRLSAFEVSDGVIGGFELEQAPGAGQGPCFHIETCLEKWLWGLTVTRSTETPRPET